jgi:hypothetical protein
MPTPVNSSMNSATEIMITMSRKWSGFRGCGSRRTTLRAAPAFDLRGTRRVLRNANVPATPTGLPPRTQLGHLLLRFATRV